jgi:2-(1,2-epoxy-1,2-dihydrophenyl)acetyl-CoA isomerase
MPEAESYHAKIRVERDGAVTTVTIDAPESKNACTGAMWVGIGRTFQEVAATDTRVVVLAGAGRDFCAGADLSGGDEGGPPGATMLDGMRVLADVVLAVRNCPLPVISKVQGVCVGAGLGLALAADLTWCAADARLCAIFAKRGLSLDFGTSYLLRERLGVHRAKELAFTARTISGSEAVELGLVNAAVPSEQLDAVVGELAATIAAGPPIAVSMMKRQIDNASGSSLAQALETEALAQMVNFKTDDLREALTAFAERRTPRFEGR